MQNNQHNVHNSALVKSRGTVNSTEIANMTFMQSVTVIECRSASISGNSKKNIINQCQLDNHAKYHSH